MGPCTLPSIEAYQSTSPFYNVPFWQTAMNRNRFQLVLRCLHVTDNSLEVNKEDRLYKVRPVVDHLNTTMLQNYEPSQNIRVNESMLLWRGRLVFR